MALGDATLHLLNTVYISTIQPTVPKLVHIIQGLIYICTLIKTTNNQLSSALRYVIVISKNFNTTKAQKIMKKINPQFSVKEIHSQQEFLKSGHLLDHATIQNTDFTSLEINWNTLDINHAVFLGCNLSANDQIQIIQNGGLIFPEPKGLSFKPYRSNLYTWQELYKETDSGKSSDLEIYEHFSKTKYAPSMMESLYRSMHDHSIDNALRDYLSPDKSGNYKIKSIGIMGGHGTLRTDHYYSKVAQTAQLLSQQDYLVVSGGGPGTMEAANLGAYMGNHSVSELLDAINIMASAPSYTLAGFHEKAMVVLDKYPNGKDSLAIPTWFYGHEPSNVFASHIAKYFSNSIREDTLLAIAIHGILFAPGSAGTTQEIFMDAAQNHYTTFDYVSPMIFMGKKRYAEDTNLYKTIQQLAKGKDYSKMLRLVDEPQEALQAFLENPPIRVD
ncbi:MAG: putative Rossmann-fold nucleotide-binding protein [Saprospiraceae bacterium]|jgi:predicted Rossmann-fold nucleotide-binding protein